MKLMDIWEELKNRKDMPQIGSDDVKDAINVMKAANIDVSVDYVLPGDLKHSQKQVNKTKVNNIVADLEKGKKMPPIIISKDNHIVDGHHRQLGYEEYAPDKKIKVYRINLPKNEAIEVYKKVEDLL